MNKHDFTRFRASNMTPEEAQAVSAKNRVDVYNAVIGTDDGTGIRCTLCRNRGNIAFIDEQSGNFTIRRCKCYGARITVKRLKQCGIWERAKRNCFDSFRTDTQTQRAMKTAAIGFVENHTGHWLMLCGQSGAGKTHLCTAAFIQLSYRFGLSGQYMLWNADGRRLKASTLEDDTGLWEKYKTCELLYIDDLFKGRQDLAPTDADIRLAFELLDHRYNNQLATIISSELPFDRLLALDQAVAGRIKEMCGPYLVSIAPDPAKNYRLGGVTRG